MSCFIKNILFAPRQPKATTMATKGFQKWSKACPKKTRKSPQGKEREVETNPKENNKSLTYIHIHKMCANSRSNAIQRPATNSYSFLCPVTIIILDILIAY